MNPAENFRVLVRQKNASFEEGEWNAVGSAFKGRCVIRVTNLKSRLRSVAFCCTALDSSFLSWWKDLCDCSLLVSTLRQQ